MFHCDNEGRPIMDDRIRAIVFSQFFDVLARCIRIALLWLGILIKHIGIGYFESSLDSSEGSLSLNN